MQFWLQLAAAPCSHSQAHAEPGIPALLGAGFLPRAGDHLSARDRRHVAWRPWKPWTPIATPPPATAAGSTPARRPARTPRSAGCWPIWSSGWAELDRLHHAITEDAQALAHAATATPVDRDGAGPRSVYSIRAAATELGVSVSMLHKLLKQRRLGHLKVGARTLITAEHLEQFREASEVPTPENSPERPPETSAERASGTAESSSVEQPRPTITAAGSPVVSVAAS